MITLLAPSKTMAEEVNPPFDATWTKPVFLSKASQLMASLKATDEAVLARRMSMSKTLATRTKLYVDRWDRRHSLATSSPVLWSYTGDIYRGFRAEQFDEKAATWANSHIRIISGLYGLLRPFDLIQPYRLEMKTQHIGDEANLYDFWGDRLAGETVLAGNGVICSLSSDEYARAVLRHLDSNIRVVTPIFVDLKSNGSYGSVPIYSKIMRGVMARWIVMNRIDNPDKLTQFSDQGYDYDVTMTVDSDHPVFLRDTPEPIRFD